MEARIGRNFPKKGERICIKCTSANWRPQDTLYICWCPFINWWFKVSWSQWVWAVGWQAPASPVDYRKMLFPIWFVLQQITVNRSSWIRRRLKTPLLDPGRTDRSREETAWQSCSLSCYVNRSSSRDVLSSTSDSTIHWNHWNDLGIMTVALALSPTCKQILLAPRRASCTNLPLQGSTIPAQKT